MLQRLWRGVVRRIYGRPDMAVDEFDLVEVSKPVAIGTEIINICNADCSFCGYGKGEKGKASDPRKKGKLSEDVFHHALKLYSEAGGGAFVLSPILGEVSAHPRWLEMVAEARSYPNITGVSCFTNAILLDRFGSRNILQSGLTQLTISTSLGSREQYKRLYGVDKYDAVVRNVFDLLETNRELGEPVEISVFLRMDKPFEAFYQTDIYKRLIEHISPSKIEILDDNWDDFSGVIGPEGLPQGHNFKVHREEKKLPCYALYRKLEILTDGTIQACACRVEPELWTGNILDHDTLEGAWRDPKLQKLRAGWWEGEIPDCCTRCSHYIPYTNLLTPARPAKVARKLLSNAKRAVMRG